MPISVLTTAFILEGAGLPSAWSHSQSMAGPAPPPPGFRSRRHGALAADSRSCIAFAVGTSGHDRQCRYLARFHRSRFIDPPGTGYSRIWAGRAMLQHAATSIRSMAIWGGAGGHDPQVAHREQETRQPQIHRWRELWRLSRAKTREAAAGRGRNRHRRRPCADFCRCSISAGWKAPIIHSLSQRGYLPRRPSRGGWA